MADRAAPGTPSENSVVVVGAGLAGLELARQLELLGVAGVTVLDAGPATDLRHIYTAHGAETADRTWLTSTADRDFHRPWTSLTPPHYTGTSGIRRRFGGRSLYWAGVTLPIEPWALASWPEEVVSDLCDCWLGGAPLYTRMDDQLRAWRAEDRSWPPLVDDRLTATIGGLDLRTTPAAIRRGRLDPSRWHAYSPLDAWRDPDTGRSTRPPSCRFAPGTEVLRVRLRRGDCTGVTVRHTGTGTVTELDAPLVVLAAGTVENSRLAIQALTEAGALDEPRLGGLTDHIVQGFLARLDGIQGARLLDAVPPGNYFACCGTRSNLYLEVVRLPDGVLLDVRVSGEQLPSADSAVEAPPATTFPWICRVRSGLSAADRKLLDAQREVLRWTWRDLADAIGVRPVDLDFDDFDGAHHTNALVLPEHLLRTASGAPTTWASYLGTEDHEGGTLPLGGPLTTRHEFAAVRGLFAAGPATFPRAGAANPGLTILALAHRLAAELASRV